MSTSAPAAQSIQFPPEFNSWSAEEKIEWGKANGVPFNVRDRYGDVWSNMVPTRRDQEANAFWKSIKPPQGLGRFGHLKNYIGLTWPHMLGPDKWNPWMERILQTICDDSYAAKRGKSIFRNVSMTGCAAASKTFTAGFYATAWWSLAPHMSIAILCTTSKSMVRKRVWPVIQDFHRTAVDAERGVRWPFGHMVDSKITLQSCEGDDKHAIFAVAVADGETQQAVHKIRGQHAQRMLLVVDEANGTPEAIFECIPNLRKACLDFTVVTIGNPVSRLDAHGQVCEPKDGWKSIGLETLEWRTKGVERWQIDPGICLRFDGADSPNVKAGDDKWPFIYTISDWDLASGQKEQSIGYWSNDRGMWPPDGSVNTILSETQLDKYQAHRGEKEFKWMSKKTKLAFLDPGFESDKALLTFGEMGDLGDGKQGVQITSEITIPIDAVSKEEIDYQVSRRCITYCQQKGVEPENFGLDRTGTGRGVAAIIAAEWSSRIHQVEFGERATERPSSTADGRPSNEVYGNRVTEMWFSVREAVTAGQLRGIGREAAIQFCTREYQMKGRKYMLIPKSEYRARFKGSPDEADSLAGVLDVARSRGFSLQTGVSARAAKDWAKAADEAEKEMGVDDSESMNNQGPGFFQDERVGFLETSIYD